MKVFIVNGSAAYSLLFQSYGFNITSNIDEAELAVFTGGSDVNPQLYGQPIHPEAYVNTFRDIQEASFFELFKERGIPMVGICRGGQFLNVMSGGEMYQDVGGHGYPHTITDLTTGETVYVSSTHHQMMKPSSKGVLVASSHIGEYRDVWTGEIFAREKSEQDNEVVFYPETKCLCFQPHPEFTGEEFAGMYSYFRSLLKRYLEV